MKQHIAVLFFSLLSLLANAQQTSYFISFGSKDTADLNTNTTFSTLNPLQFISQKAIDRRLKFNLPVITVQDLPINEAYITEVLNKGFQLQHTLKWFNGIIVSSTTNNIDSINKLPFIKSIQLIASEQIAEKEKEIDLTERINLLAQKFDKNELIDSSSINGFSNFQLALNNIDQLHKKQLKGAGKYVAVFDAGFKNMQRSPYFNQQNIIATYNLVNSDESVFASNQEEHGLSVAGCIAANAPYRYMGAAPEAKLVLFETEVEDSELPIEEYYWAKAAELADSLGVDIINSSLGYTVFDDEKLGHKYKEFSGNKTLIAQAANIAVSKGILVVVSAGNEGDKIWEKVSTPADADSVITVAACDAQKTVTTFSSVGFSKGKNQKPEVTALGEKVQLVNAMGKVSKGNGTSYSTPIITGLSACLMEAYPNKNPHAIKQAFILSADQYYDHNKYLGYGIVDALLAYEILADYTRDTLLDFRPLADSNYHAVVFSSSAQKVEIEIEIQSGDEKIISRQKEKIQEGINRFAVIKTKKLQQGVYILKIKTNAGVFLIKRFEKL
ncbi:MAG: S8 family serine peptidase [Bacteroidota bacterium]